MKVNIFALSGSLERFGLQSCIDEGFLFPSTNNEMLGCVLVGFGDLEIQYLDSSTVNSLQVDSLKNEINEVKANAKAKETELQAKLNKLLALGST
jgi:hypothetical protein